MHVIPSLQVVTRPSTLEVDLSNCILLEKLTVQGMLWSFVPPFVTAALLKGVTASRSPFEEVTLDMCDYGMYCVCVCVCVCMCECDNV